MPIGSTHHDIASDRMVDDASGIAMSVSLFDREEQEWSFGFHDMLGEALFAGRFTRHAYGEDPDTGGATHVRFSLTRAWFPAGPGREPFAFTGPTEWIETLRRFLDVYRHRSGVKRPDPIFEFQDARLNIRGRPVP